MAYLGLISIDIPEKVVSAVKQKVSEIDALLKPYYLELSTKQIDGIPKLGNELLPFVEDCLREIKANTDFLLKNADTEEMNRDKMTFDKSKAMAEQLTTVSRNLDSVKIASGSDILTVCLAYYQSVQRGAKMGQPGAKAIYERLRVHFQNKSKKSEKPSPVLN